MNHLKLIIYSTIILSFFAYKAQAAERETTMVRAPELLGGTGWLNTDKPIYIKDLKGKVVLLDFWTYGCINCIHIIPDLKKLEAKYPNELVVIGVHSAKFNNEKDSANIRRIILRYGIEHPVVNDSEFRIWRSYGVRAWPTLVLINPDGYVAGVVSGEGHYEALDNAIGALIADFSQKGKLDKVPIALALEKFKEPDTALSFPGKIIVGTIKSSPHLFISDSNHHRIVITDLEGNLVDIIGNGKIGKDDGSYDKATFNKPQGISLDNQYLYVADTENHNIRRVDLNTKTVKTIAGTGQQARGYGSGGTALQTPLSSPWDLIVIKDKIYIAMAGPHQIWVMDIKTDNIRPYAGSGHEGIDDGLLMKASLAQPSGITTDGKKLYIADSEASAIRSIDLNEKGKVETIIGMGLFEFGDKDGQGREVRLQHPLGVLYHKGKLYVADTYNHKIKIVNPEKKTSQTFLGVGLPGNADGDSPRFYEPGGLAIYGNKMYIADTNNHSIRVADLTTKTVQTLTIAGLEEELGLPKETIVFPSRSIRANAKGNLTLNLNFPAGYKLTEGAPFDYEIEKCGEDSIKFTESNRKKSMISPKLPLIIPFTTSKGKGSCQLKVELNFNYCQEATGVCFIKDLILRVPIQIKEEEKEQRIYLEYKIPPQ